MFKKLVFVFSLAMLFILPSFCLAKSFSKPITQTLPTQPQVVTKQYVSKDGDYNVVYPDIFKNIKQEKSTNKITFTGKDNDVKLFVWQEKNDQNLDVYNLLQQKKQTVSHIQKENYNKNGYHIIYSNDGGLDGREMIFEEKAVINKGRLVKYLVVYPDDQKKQLEPSIKQIKIIFKSKKS